MDPAPEATIFAVGVSDKVDSSLWNALERDKWAHQLQPHMRQVTLRPDQATILWVELTSTGGVWTSTQLDVLSISEKREADLLLGFGNSHPSPRSLCMSRSARSARGKADAKGRTVPITKGRSALRRLKKD